jgi:hypothetical protein
MGFIYKIEQRTSFNGFKWGREGVRERDNGAM